MKIKIRPPAIAVLAYSAILMLSVFPAQANEAGVPFEPYVDVTLWPPADLVEFSQSMGHNKLTVAFIQSDGTCTPKWAGIIGFNDPTYDFEGKIAALKAAGGDAIISIGGASGIPLADVCYSVTELKDAYRAVVDQYQIDMLDFDIEGAAIAKPPEVAKRSAAIAALQKELAGEGKRLEVSLTLPTLSTGLTGDDTTPFDGFGGYDVVTSARDAGVDLAVVNIMAMDYYQPHCASAHLDENSSELTPMGQCGLDAAVNLQRQLVTIFPGFSDAKLWSMVGVTPMIGQNDALAEVFTLADAEYLKAFAEEHQIGRLAMWSVHRDQPCPGGGATYNCNGISTGQWAFTEVFRGEFDPPSQQCADGIDNDGDGLIDIDDPGCDSAVGDGINENSDNSAPPPPLPGDVQLSYEITSDWGGGYNAEMTVTNIGDTTIDGWRLEFDSANPIGSLWNGTMSADGSYYTITHASWNRTLRPGASATIGFGATGDSRMVPTDCLINGEACFFDDTPALPPPLPVGECEDGIDNDGDDVIDAADPGCGAEGDGVKESSANPEPPSGEVSVENVVITSDWGTGYCADGDIVNGTGSPISTWTAFFSVAGDVSSLWNVNWSQNGSTINLTPSSWNSWLDIGASASFGYCASR